MSSDNVYYFSLNGTAEKHVTLFCLKPFFIQYVLLEFGHGLCCSAREVPLEF